MFADAAREVRHHPGRIIATLVAIAISVGFMAAVSIFVKTQTDALGKGMALASSKADLVVDVSQGKQGVTSKQLTDAISKVPGVKQVERSAGTYAPISTPDKNVYVQVFAVPSETFRWSAIKDGAWPTKADEIALSTQLADKLGVKVGGQVSAGEQKMTVSGTVADAPNVFFQTAYMPHAALAQIEQGDVSYASWLVRAEGDRAQVGKDVRAAVAPLVVDPDTLPYPEAKARGLEVVTGAEAQSKAIKEVTNEFDVMKYMLWAFSAISALVGTIIIANTFSILLAQRRRQIGLLRAVGASGAQVRRKFLAEAVLLGAMGSALGLLLGTLIAWSGATFTKATYWGMSFPLGELGFEFGVGIILTVLAAMLPALRATRVAPLEALQPVATSEQERKSSIVRAVVCGLFLLCGVALAVYSLTAKVGGDASPLQGPVVTALLGAILISIGVLFGATLFIPTLLKVMGTVFGAFGATPRLAAMNAVRNPKRASATATALMLACGLIITLQVGTATAEKTVLGQIAASYPIDLAVTSNGGGTGPDGKTTNGLAPDTLASLDKVGNVAARATLAGGLTETGPGSRIEGTVIVLALTPESKAVTDVVPTTLPDGEALLGKDYKAGTKVVLKANGQTITLVGKPSKALDGNQVMVNEATMKKVVAQPAPQVMWLKLKNLDDMGTTMNQLERLQEKGAVNVSGSAMESFMVKKILGILMMVTTGLLGVAVLIALIGVSNTLGLSVIERARESALLRALGMQKGSLRLMLLVEALMLALAGVVVGVLAGGFFGWLGMRAVMRQAEMTTPLLFGINWPITLGLVAVAVLAASLASILPGRRAANATPTEALAEA